MYEKFENMTEVAPLLVLLFGGIAGYRVGQLVFRSTAKELRRSVRRVYVLFGIAVLGVVLEVYSAAHMVSFGWIFAGNRFVVATPPMAIAAVAAAVLSVPRLHRLRRAARGEPALPLPAALRSAATEPRLVVPVQAFGFAGLFAFYTVFVGRPIPPYTVDVVEINGLLLAVAALLWRRQLRRQWRLGGEQPRARAHAGIRLLKFAGGLAAVATFITASVLVYSTVTKVPTTYNMGMAKNMDYGGGPAPAMAMGPDGMAGTSVDKLTGGSDTTGTPDDVFTLTAQAKQITMNSGRTVGAWTFNGQVPGPELRVHDGDLVQVTLVNKIPGIGVTVHWHGLDVPNAMDGVPGVTQNAVRTGESFVYRFRVHQVGTFWYHSHEEAASQLDRGLFGAIISLPKGVDALPGTTDLTVPVHDWRMLHDVVTFGGDDMLATRKVTAGSQVRLRVINTGTYVVPGKDNHTPTFVLSGAPFRVAAIDGTDLHEPGELADGTNVPIGTGGRADLTFTMPDHPVRLTDLDAPNNGLVLSPDGTGTVPAPSAGGPLFDPIHYGTPTATPFGAGSTFTRNFTLVLDDGPGFYDGHLEARLTINARVFPDTPMLMVSQGDLVKVTLVDRGHTNHPFHLHGHHALVLSHNGQPATGSPVWTDTVELGPGESYVVAFRADNPGIWMDHCHNLQHAEKGMIMHLGYVGVTDPYQAGPGTGNNPE